MENEKKIFISHSSENKLIIEKLCNFMVAIGINRNQIFCSSIVGQGVKNGEKLNDRIMESIHESALLIFVLSSDFLNSSYCMEELGVGWYLSENNLAKCYYLVLPDIFSLLEIKGFVNSNTNKLSRLNDREELGQFADNLCEYLEMPKPSYSAVSNAMSTFISETTPLFNSIIEKRNQIEKEKKQKEEELNTLRENNKQLNQSTNLLSQQLDYERKQHKIEMLAKEYHTIEEDFNHFGGQTGITVEKYKGEGSHFWLYMVSRYLRIRNELKKYDYPRLYHENIEILIATIYSAHGDLDESYEFIKSFFLHVRSTIYPSVFKNIVFDDKNDTRELIEIIEKKIDNTEKGIIQDSYKQSLIFLLERKRSIEKEVANA